MSVTVSLFVTDVSVSVTVFAFVFVTVIVTVSVDPWDMLNNFCFHVYAQMFVGENDNGYFFSAPCPLLVVTVSSSVVWVWRRP